MQQARIKFPKHIEMVFLNQKEIDMNLWNVYYKLKKVNAKFLRNRRRAIKFDPSIKKNKSVETRIAKRREWLI